MLSHISYNETLCSIQWMFNIDSLAQCPYSIDVCYYGCVLWVQAVSVNATQSGVEAVRVYTSLKFLYLQTETTCSVQFV